MAGIVLLAAKGLVSAVTVFHFKEAVSYARHTAHPARYTGPR